MRKPLRGYFQTPNHECCEVLQLIGSPVGVKSKEMEQLLSEEQGGVTR